MTLTALLLLCALGAPCIFFVRALYIGLFCGTLSSIPGPWYSRYTHLVLKFYTLAGRRIYYVDSLHSKYGGVVRIAPDEVAISDLDGFAKIHKIGSGFLKAPSYETLVGNKEPGIFAERDPHRHAARRRLFAQAFSNSALQRNWASEIHQKAYKAVARIKADALAGEADILKWWTLMATDVIAHLAFGESFDMLELGKVRSFPNLLTRSMAVRDIGLICSCSKHPISMPFKTPYLVVFYAPSFLGCMKSASGCPLKRFESLPRPMMSYSSTAR
jgi:hypothetical protein